MKVNFNTKVILRTCAILLILVLAWYFFNLVIYIFLAFIFALIGKPIARKISQIKIYKFGIPRWISTLLTMAVFILFFTMILYFFVPLLIREAQTISGINYDALSRNLSNLLDNVQDFLYNNQLIEEHETLVGLITGEVKNFASLTNFSNLLSGVVSVTGSFLMGIFAVFFLTFFFIKDDVRIDKIAQLLFNEHHVLRLTIVSEKINQLLSRYFIGLLIEIISMITLLYIGLAIFGIKGASLMAFFGGILNAIPYLGPLIGLICSCLFGIIDCLNISDYQAISSTFPDVAGTVDYLSISNYQAIPSTMMKIAGTFIVANLIDNIVLQPIIYSHSVRTHPVEIFLVIIMGGSLAGVMGMLFAIPVYTIVRTITVELFKD